MEKRFDFRYDHYDNLNDMPKEDLELILEARKAAEKAYAAYSNFKVGAAARLKSGKVISASNQESEVYPSGMCAERSLLYYYGGNMSDDPIADFAIVSIPAVRECYPCGNCRQTLWDIEKRQKSPIRVIMAGDNSATVLDSAKKLLPFIFEL